MSPASRWLAAALLAVLAAGHIYLRTRQCVSLPRFDLDDETGYFRAESALQYRYARLTAQGAGIPELDRDAQYPEGLDTRRHLTLAMERATGWTWRLVSFFAPVRDFRWFVLLWSAVMASLSLPALYAIAGRLSRSPPLALAAAALFAASWAGMSNGIGTYGFESFALPMLLCSLAFLVAALDPEEDAWKACAVAAGLLLAAGLSSWHFARFHLAALWLALAWAAWRCRKEQAALARLRGAVGSLAACAAAAGLLCGPLRETLFLLSPVMLAGYGLLAWLFFPARPWAWALGTAAAAGLSVWLSRDPAAYGHVYGLLWEKLRHGLVKPADPSLLGPDARLLWVGPFQSPEPGFALFAFLPLACVLLPRLAAAARRETTDAPGRLAAAVLMDGLLALYAAGAAMVARLTPVLAFLLCAAACRLPAAWLRSAWLPAAFFLLAGLEGAKALAPASPLNPFLRLSAAWARPDRHPAASFSNERALILWLEKNGGPGRPVLANYGLSASLLTYARCPVLLQPKFEAPGIRAKTLEYLRALYASQDEFASFCRKYRAALFVYSVEDILDETPDGPRYASGDLRLRPESAAVLFHFQPERLKRFRLVYENPDFRVFSFSDKEEKLPAAGPLLPVYDLSRYDPRVDDAGFLRLDAAGVNARMAASRRLLFLARVFTRLGRGEEALSAYEAAAEAWPPDAASQKDALRLRSALEAAASRGARR